MPSGANCRHRPSTTLGAKCYLSYMPKRRLILAVGFSSACATIAALASVAVSMANLAVTPN